MLEKNGVYLSGIIFILVLVVFCNKLMVAQDNIQLGVHLNPTVSVPHPTTTTVYDHDFHSLRPGVGFKTGVNFNLRTSYGIGLRTGFSYVYKKYYLIQTSVGGPKIPGYIRTFIQSDVIELPIIASFSFKKVADDKIWINTFAGITMDWTFGVGVGNKIGDGCIFEPLGKIYLESDPQFIFVREKSNSILLGASIIKPLQNKRLIEVGISYHHDLQKNHTIDINNYVEIDDISYGTFNASLNPIQSYFSIDFAFYPLVY